MSQDEFKSGVDAFNEVPSWYADSQPPPPPPMQQGGQPQHYRGAPMHQPAKKRRIGAAIGLGLLAKFAVFGVLAVIGLFLVRGTTSAAMLARGDCFMMPTATSITRVDSAECTEPHDSQVIEEITVEGPDEYPSDTHPYWDSVFAQCEDIARALIVNGELLPADARIETFNPVESGWNRGEREHTCILHAPSGLTGSFMRLPA